MFCLKTTKIKLSVIKFQTHFGFTNIRSKMHPVRAKNSKLRSFTMKYPVNWCKHCYNVQLLIEQPMPLNVSHIISKTMFQNCSVKRSFTTKSCTLGIVCIFLIIEFFDFYLMSKNLPTYWWISVGLAFDKIEKSNDFLLHIPWHSVHQIP